jgi:precorrin-2/cobalt-factor-2 C20-methyltransferase
MPITIKDESFVLCDGEPDEEMLKRVDSICILKMSRNKETILSLLEKNNFKYAYVRRCSQDEQKILFDKQDILSDNDYMSLIFARKNKR